MSYCQKHDEYWMQQALYQAETALNNGEVPVGCVIVKENQLVGMGYNRRETDCSVLGHAEIMAIETACQTLKTWRLAGCELYVTLEPCPMCAGAIINARIQRVVYGVSDAKFGCCGSVADFFAMPFPHTPLHRSGILEDKCRGILQHFFQQLR